MSFKWLDSESGEQSLEEQLSIEKRKKMIEKKERSLERRRLHHDKLMEISRAEEDAKRIQKAKERAEFEEKQKQLLKVFKSCVDDFKQKKKFSSISENLNFLNTIITLDHWLYYQEIFKKAFNERKNHKIECDACKIDKMYCLYEEKILQQFTDTDIQFIVDFFKLNID
jgi:hypothetical protein